jgi:hypothetical protein
MLDLLGVSAQDELDAEHRRDDRDKPGHGDQELEDESCRRDTTRREQGGDRRVLREEVADGGREEPEHAAQHGERDRPGDDRAAVEPEGEHDRPDDEPAAGRPGSRRDQPHAEVTPALQGRGDRCPEQASVTGAIDEFVVYYEKHSPLPRVLEPGEVGNVAAFLCSPLAGAITGTTIHVDNGFHVMGKGLEDNDERWVLGNKG